MSTPTYQLGQEIVFNLGDMQLRFMALIPQDAIKTITNLLI